MKGPREGPNTLFDVTPLCGCVKAQRLLVRGGRPSSAAAARRRSRLIMADDEITIKFTIVPEGFSHERKLKKSLTVLELKQQVEAYLRIPVNSMKLVFQGQEMLAPTLGEYSFSPTDVNHVELQIVYTDEGQQAPATTSCPT